MLSTFLSFYVGVDCSVDCVYVHSYVCIPASFRTLTKLSSVAGRHSSMESEDGIFERMNLIPCTLYVLVCLMISAEILAH